MCCWCTRAAVSDSESLGRVPANILSVTEQHWTPCSWWLVLVEAQRSVHEKVVICAAEEI